MFNTITFWCEFPKTTNWENINKLLNFKANIYIASSTKQEFLKYKSKIKNKYIQTIGVWPILTKEQGYWFSSYSKKAAIDKISDFKGIPMKIDIEPPIFKGLITAKKYLTYFFKYFTFFKGKNSAYLKDKIASLNQLIIVSTFPFPDFILKRAGGNFFNNIQKNFFVYTSLLPKILQPLARLYYSFFIKSKLKQNPNTMIAIGCTGPGIFSNEEAYKNKKEFKKDLDMINNLNVKNAVIFEFSSLSNKHDAKDWFNLIKSYLYIF